MPKDYTQEQIDTINQYLQIIQNKQKEKPDSSLGIITSKIIRDEKLHPDKQSSFSEKEKAQAKFNLDCIQNAKLLLEDQRALKDFHQQRNAQGANASNRDNTEQPPAQQPMDVNNVPEHMRQAVVLHGAPTLELGDGNEARQRFIEALKKEFDHPNSFGSFNRAEYNNPGPGSSFHCGDGGVSFTECTYKGQPAIAVHVNPSLYMQDGKIDQDKCDDLHAEAAAKCQMAKAEAKYADNPAKGLAELKEQKQFFLHYNGHDEGSDEVARMDERTASKIESLLLEREKSLNNTATPHLTNSPDKPAIGNNPTEKHASSSVVERKRDGIGQDQLQQDASKQTSTQNNAPVVPSTKH